MNIILYDFEIQKLLKDGRCQMRRVIKELPECAILDMKREPKFQDPHMAEWLLKNLKCPFGAAGEEIWCKETWQLISPDEYYRPAEECDIIYRATDEHPGFSASEYRWNKGLKNEDGADIIFPWKSPVTMPRSASHLTIIPERIWVERVQDINRDGILAEGIVNKHTNPTMGKRWENSQFIAFQDVFDSHAKPGYKWADNPMVWCAEVMKVKDYLKVEKAGD